MCPRLTLILCAVTVTFAAFSTCRLLEARPVADAERENWGETVDGLQSRLTASKNEHKLGEDIVVTLNIRNVSNKEITLLEHGVKGSCLCTRFLVEAPNGDRILLANQQLARTTLLFPASRSLQPDETYEWTALLNRWRPPRMHLGSYTFLPGTYKIRAEYSPGNLASGSGIWKGTLYSNALLLQVTNQALHRDPKKVLWGDPRNGVRCGLTFDKVVYGYCEKVSGTIFVENVGSKTADDGGIVIPDIGSISVSGAYENVPLTGNLESLKHPGTFRIEKGAVRRVRFDLTSLAQRYGLVGPATLEVRASVRAASRKTRILLLDIPHSIGLPSTTLTDGLSETAQPAKAVFSTGEPLCFRTTFENVSAETVLLYDPDYFAEWNFMFLDPKEKANWRAEHRWKTDRIPPPPVVLRPGDTHTFDVVLRSSDFKFFRTGKTGKKLSGPLDALLPGTYQLRFNRELLKGPDDLAEKHKARYWAGWVNTRPVAFSVVAGKVPTTERVVKLKGALKELAVTVAFYMRHDEAAHLWKLSLVNDKTPEVAKIELAWKIVDFLAEDGFLGTARNVGTKPTPRVPPCVILHVSHPALGRLDEDLGLDAATVGRLRSLELVLAGAPKKAFEHLLKEIEAEFKKRTHPTAVQRAELLKGTKRFRLVLQYHGRQPWLSRYLSLDLFTLRPVEHWKPRHCRRAGISRDQAARIIDHLAAEGFLEHSVNILAVDHQRSLARANYSLTIRGPAKTILREDLGWSLEMLKRLDSLRKVLDGDAAKAMDKVVNRLRKHRKQWEAKPGKKAAAKAEQGTWDEAVDGLRTRLQAEVGPHWKLRVREDTSPGKQGIHIFATNEVLKFDTPGSKVPHATMSLYLRPLSAKSLSAITQAEGIPLSNIIGETDTHRLYGDVLAPRNKEDILVAVRSAIGVRWGAALNGLRCRMELPKAPLTAGDRTLVTFVLQNSGNKPIRIFDMTDVHGSLCFDFAVIDEKGASLGCEAPGAEFVEKALSGGTLQRGESYRRQVHLYAWKIRKTGKGVLRAPGRYRLIGFYRPRPPAKLGYWTGSVHTVPVPIEIAQRALPGSRLSIEEAVKRHFAFAAVCEALEEARVHWDEAGVCESVQKFRILVVFGGRARVGQTMKLGYQWLFIPSCCQRAIRKAERVIWIVREAPKGNVPPWRGIKALPDTPENRKAVVEAVGAEMAWGPVSNGLQCRLLPLEQAVEVVEGAKAEDVRVFVTYELRNVGKKAVKFLPRFTPLGGAYSRPFKVVGPDGKRAGFCGEWKKFPKPKPEDFITIQSGQRLTRRVRVPYELARPGAYRISTTTTRRGAPDGGEIVAYYGGDIEKATKNPDNVWTGTLTSNTVTVNVVRARED